MRGFSSQHHPKKSFKLEIQDSFGGDLKVPLLDMPKESDWILSAAYSDKTFMRNPLAHDVWGELGHYAVRWRYIELSMPSNSLAGTFGGEHADYQGIYMLMEKIKRGKTRVRIDKVSDTAHGEPQITGGYIFKKERFGDRDRGFQTSQRVHIVFDEPKDSEITPQQEHWLTNHINEFEAVLFGEHFADPANGYRKYIDIDSFIDYHWIVEMSRNTDGYHFSIYYHKDRGGKIKAGPIWDWDISFGNCFYVGGDNPKGWQWARLRGSHYKWYGRLFEDPDFLQRYIDRWSELRTNVFATSNILAKIDRYTDQLTNSGAVDRNFKRWPILGKFVHPNRFIGKTWQEEVDFLKNWITRRLEWIDSQDFPKPIIQVQSLKSTAQSSDTNSPNSLEFHPLLVSSSKTLSFYFPPSAMVKIAWFAGTPYYTADGSDPRLSGGAVSPKAIKYKDPILIKPGDKLIVRVKGDSDAASRASVTNQPPSTLNEPCLWSAPQVLTF